MKIDPPRAALTVGGRAGRGQKATSLPSRERSGREARDSGARAKGRVASPALAAERQRGGGAVRSLKRRHATRPRRRPWRGPRRRSERVKTKTASADRARRAPAVRRPAAPQPGRPRPKTMPGAPTRITFGLCMPRPRRAARRSAARDAGGALEAGRDPHPQLLNDAAGRGQLCIIPTLSAEARPTAKQARPAHSRRRRISRPSPRSRPRAGATRAHVRGQSARGVNASAPTPTDLVQAAGLFEPLSVADKGRDQRCG